MDKSSWRIGAAGAQKYAADRKCIENGRSKKDEHEAGKAESVEEGGVEVVAGAAAAKVPAHSRHG